MTQLHTLFAELGFDEVETFIGSGNVVFSSKARASSKLESRIANHLHASLGYKVDTFVRAVEDVAAIGKAKIFAEDGRPGMTIHVAFLKQALPPEVARSLLKVRTAEDEFRVVGREYYWLCRVRTSDSKVWTLPEIRALKLPTATMRNIFSIRKLVAKQIAAAQGSV